MVIPVDVAVIIFVETVFLLVFLMMSFIAVMAVPVHVAVIIFVETVFLLVFLVILFVAVMVISVHVTVVSIPVIFPFSMVIFLHRSILEGISGFFSFVERTSVLLFLKGAGSVFLHFLFCFRCSVNHRAVSPCGFYEGDVVISSVGNRSVSFNVFCPGAVSKSSGSGGDEDGGGSHEDFSFQCSHDEHFFLLIKIILN